jgi:hypothetical protein
MVVPGGEDVGEVLTHDVVVVAAGALASAIGDGVALEEITSLA